MVALKRGSRGLILTVEYRSRNAVVALKLGILSYYCPRWTREAGTPWWH